MWWRRKSLAVGQSRVGRLGEGEGEGEGGGEGGRGRGGEGGGRARRLGRSLPREGGGRYRVGGLGGGHLAEAGGV